MSDDSSDPGADGKSPPSSAIADRTAADVFASLAAEGPGVDTDAILEGTSPEEIIERTNDPEPSSSVDPSLFDEAELTELILPERRSDGTFLWVETTDTEPESDTEPAPGTEGVSIRTWQDPDYERPDAASNARSTSMTDASDTSQSDASTRTTSVADSTGFDSTGARKAETVPPRTGMKSEPTGGRSVDHETDPGRRDRKRPDSSSARESRSQPRASTSESEPEAEPTSKSEIRTSVAHFEHRKPDSGASGLIASVKRVVSRVLRPGRSG